MTVQCNLAEQSSSRAAGKCAPLAEGEAVAKDVARCQNGEKLARCHHRRKVERAVALNGIADKVLNQ